MGTQSTALLRTAARLYGFMTEKTLELDKASCRNNEEPCDMLAAAWRTLTSQTQAYNQQAIPHIKHHKP